MPDDSANGNEPEDSKIIDALNRHGMFFHRAIYNQFLEYKHAEGKQNPFVVRDVLKEHPTYFNGHGAADLVVFTTFRPAAHVPAVKVVFVLECKKTLPSANRIILFGDGLGAQTRLMWESYAVGDGNKAVHSMGWVAFQQEPEAPVCDDGLWLKRDQSGWKADKDPLYKTANQVCGHLMGVMRARTSQAVGEADFGKGDTLAYFFPIIVTNCPIFVADSSGGGTDLESGEASGVELKSVESAFYIHPYASIPGDASDVRNELDDFEGEDLERDKHTILIIRPPALNELFGENFFKEALVNVFYGPLYERAMGR